MLSLIKRKRWTFGSVVLAIFIVLLFRNDFQRHQRENRQKMFASLVKLISYEMKHAVIANLSNELREIADASPEEVNKQALIAKLHEIFTHFNGCSVKGMSFAPEQSLAFTASNGNIIIIWIFNDPFKERWITQIDSSFVILDSDQQFLNYDNSNGPLSRPAFEDPKNYVAVMECPDDNQLSYDISYFMDLMALMQP
jgi:hypothetical protein